MGFNKRRLSVVGLDVRTQSRPRTCSATANAFTRSSGGNGSRSPPIQSLSILAKVQGMPLWLHTLSGLSTLVAMMSASIAGLNSEQLQVLSRLTRSKSCSGKQSKLSAISGLLTVSCRASPIKPSTSWKSSGRFCSVQSPSQPSQDIKNRSTAQQFAFVRPCPLRYSSKAVNRLPVKSTNAYSALRTLGQVVPLWSAKTPNISDRLTNLELQERLTSSSMARATLENITQYSEYVIGVGAMKLARSLRVLPLYRCVPMHTTLQSSRTHAPSLRLTAQSTSSDCCYQAIALRTRSVSDMAILRQQSEASA